MKFKNRHIFAAEMKLPRKCEANMMSVRKFLLHKHYHCPAYKCSISKCVFRQLAKKLSWQWL